MNIDIIIIILFLILLFLSRTEEFSNTHKVYVKISKTPEEIKKGLMFRKNKLPKDHGMLFDMGFNGIHSFWMVNTYIPLDMIFLDKNYKIVGFIKNRKPLDERSMNIGKKSYHVLEMNGGWIENNDVKVNDMIEIIEKNFS